MFNMYINVYVENIHTVYTFTLHAISDINIGGFT